MTTIIEQIERLEKRLPGLQGIYRQNAQTRILALRKMLREGVVLEGDRG